MTKHIFIKGWESDQKANNTLKSAYSWKWLECEVKTAVTHGSTNDPSCVPVVADEEKAENQ